VVSESPGAITAVARRAYRRGYLSGFGDLATAAGGTCGDMGINRTYSLILRSGLRKIRAVSDRVRFGVPRACRPLGLDVDTVVVILIPVLVWRQLWRRACS
jgi:hypothetical protein